MSEHRIGLDVAGGGGGHLQNQSGSAGNRDPASQEHADRFRRALTGDGSPESSSEASPVPAQHPRARGPFDLFGRRSDPAPAADPQSIPSAALGAAFSAQRPADVDATPERDNDRAWKAAAEVAARILVSADEEREARVYIREDVLAGVELRIRRDQGRWVVTFLVADTTSFGVLSQAAGMIATELARRLRSSVEVQLTAARGPETSDEPALTFFADPPDGSGESP